MKLQDAINQFESKDDRVFRPENPNVHASLMKAMENAKLYADGYDSAMRDVLRFLDEEKAVALAVELRRVMELKPDWHE